MKKNVTKCMAMGMVLTMLASTAVFADEMMLISANPNAVTDVAEAVVFTMQTGTIKAVEQSETDQVMIITMENETGGLRFAVAPQTMIADRATNAVIPAEELKEGMSVSVIYDRNSPMGMSLPPYLGNVTAVVANADAGFVAVGKFDQDLIDWTNKLQLNIAEETSIQNMQGSRIRLSAEDIKGKEALVFYQDTTKSIPAQTTPSFVLILEEQKAPAISVPLRETAEANGFSVTWQGRNKPILLEKEEVCMEIMLDNTTYTINGVEQEAELVAELRGATMFVSSDIFE